VVVRSAVTGSESSQGLMCQHTEVPSHRKMTPHPVHFKWTLG